MFRISLRFFTVFILLLVFFGSNLKASGPDEWIAVRSTNFYLIGNATETDIRDVGIKLEQFREHFSRTYQKYNFESPVATTVFVLKNADTVDSLKSVKYVSKTAPFAEGFFLAAEDSNYITVNLDGADLNKVYEKIFHAYTHYLIDNGIGKTNLPPWFSEGVAEYYQSFKIEGEQKLTLGGRRDEHLQLLEQNKFLPTDLFFNLDNYTLRQQGEDGTGLFYAQAWALMHYLHHGRDGARRNQLFKFLDLTASGKSSGEAFNESFQTNNAGLEQELKSYLSQKIFNQAELNRPQDLKLDSSMTASRLPASEVKAFLGELLFYTDRLADAEKLLLDAISLNPDSSRALSALGLVKMRQGDFKKARHFAERAVKSGGADYLAYYRHAFILSREGTSEFGFVSDFARTFSHALAEKMRELLKKAIALNPSFAESFELFALISAARNERLDEAVEYLKRALRIAPGNQDYQIRLAELYMWKENFAEAKKIAEKVSKTAAEPRLKVYAENTFERILNYEVQMYYSRNPLARRGLPEITDRILTEEELRILREQGLIESLNMLVAKPQRGEKRVLGYVTQIDCQGKSIYYTVKTENQTLRLHSESFETIKLISYNRDMGNAVFGCGPLKAGNFAVIVYSVEEKTETKIAGELKSIEFVPANFRFLF
jgi:Tfp pilus assembly protein PilF